MAAAAAACYSPARIAISCSSSSSSAASMPGRPLRVAVVGGGPAGASAAEALALAGARAFLLERNPAGAKPCGGAIPLCMLDEFAIPRDLVDRRVTRMRILSPSNLATDFSRALPPGAHIPMLRREVLDSFLRRRAADAGAALVPGLVTSLSLPTGPSDPYLVHYISSSSSEGTGRGVLEVDAVVGADGANSRVAREVGAGDYTTAIAFQERIRLPEAAMAYYDDLAEMYLGGDVSPDFYGWVFPKCDHVAVGTGTVAAKPEIKRFQSGIRARAGAKIAGGRVVKVEAHPIPEHPRPRRVVGRVALVGDAAGYVTRCSGEGIYFAAKSGRLCGQAMAEEWARTGAVTEAGLRQGYLRRWDDEFLLMFRFLDLLQRVFYVGNAGREALVEMCADEYVQRRSFESYLYKQMVPGDPRGDLRLLWRTVASMVRCGVLGREVERLRRLELQARELRV
ncbi:geranylgeranyl diphosphate reductase, chloroplastic-like [Phragmites australis]|uniref:geranylgeranyl diphosphate reductase, chloroplastic-like n=1 Tax=Phragmites australis TaxID=29695 RepID=UPI002D77CB88|nr:geranylgeranyl diphosphate reductase, chloroplastic-like [Phragmites australis]